MRPMVLSVRSKGGLRSKPLSPLGRTGLCLFIFSLLIAVASAATAQQEERVFGQYLRYLMQQEGYNLTDAIKEIQSLQQGKESIIQSYIKTEQDLQNLEKSAFSTKQSELDDYANYNPRLRLGEKLYPQPEFPSWEEVGDEKTNSSYSDESFSDVPFQFEKNFPLPSHSSYEETEKILKAKFLLKDLKEFIKDGHTNLSITLENIGDVVDALVIITDESGMIIANPYFQRIQNFSASKSLYFQLLQKEEKLIIQIDTEEKTVKIPVLLHGASFQPQINVQPFSQTARIGGTAEYSLTLEGNAEDEKKYKLSALHLPGGILATFLLSESGVPVDEVKFSSSKKIHQLILKLTISTELDTKLIGKAIPFLVAMGSGTLEQLTITPIGVGKIAIEAPFEELKLRLGQKKAVKIRVENMGSAEIPKLEIFADDTILGIQASASPQLITLQKGEIKEVTLTVFATETAKMGTHEITITAQAKGEQALSEEVTLQVQVAEREKAFFLSSTSLLPGFFLIAVAIGIAFSAYTLKRLARKKEEFDEEVEEEIEYV